MSLMGSRNHQFNTTIRDTPSQSSEATITNCKAVIKYLQKYLSKATWLKYLLVETLFQSSQCASCLIIKIRTSEPSLHRTLFLV
jgi:hypothetical protein